MRDLKWRSLSSSADEERSWADNIADDIISFGPNIISRELNQEKVQIHPTKPRRRGSVVYSLQTITRKDGRTKHYNPFAKLQQLPVTYFAGNSFTLPRDYL